MSIFKTKNFLGIGIINTLQQVPQTREASQKAARLAKNRYLREAVTIAEKTLSFWPKESGFWQRWICQILLGNLLNELTQQLQQWQKQVTSAEKLANSAKNLLDQKTEDPWETEPLANAITLYKRCSQILHDEQILQAIKQCKEELQRRQLFQVLVQEAQSQTENRFFKSAISTYAKAEQLYSTKAVAQAIATIKFQAQQEEVYYSTLKRVQQAETEGKLQQAISLLEAVLSTFSRTDGYELLDKLKSLIEGREIFRRALLAEKIGEFKTAIVLYEQAKSLLPDNTNCQIRLALVAIKITDWALAISYLEDLSGEQATYLRGFIHAKQDNLQLAYREWQGVSSINITEQQKILKLLSQRQRLLSLQDIEQFVKVGNLEQAEAASINFIQRFGYDSLVEENLKQYIQPSLKSAVWQKADWKAIKNQAEKDWIADPSIITLHNWAIANYYYVQNYSSEFEILIISLSSALSNLNTDLVLEDVPWLANKPIDFGSVFNKVTQHLESIIDGRKDINTNDYLRLRDYWRLESAALKLMGTPTKRGVKINDVFVTPGCYSHYISLQQPISIRQIDTTQKILHCLYTSWGLAVAACIARDIQRAIQLKPLTRPNSDFETFAQKFVTYHEGCFYLQQNRWREAINPFKQLKQEIRDNQDWKKEIDKLCESQRQSINRSEQKENLDFARFWYDISESKTAKTYLAEYKVEQIREQLTHEQISKQEALKELEKLKQFDVDNPIVIDLIQRIKTVQASEIVDNYLKRNDLEGAVNFAKSDGNRTIKNFVAEICIDILTKGFKTRELGFEEIYNLGRWAYELCPEYQYIQEIYMISQELNKIYTFIKHERFEDAIFHAKCSQYDLIKSYVADYFIMILIKGVQSKRMPFYLIQKLCRWAYELCPNDPSYQEIYRQFNIY